MNEQDFQVRVVKYLAGELSEGEAQRVLEEKEASVERKKFFEDYSQIWQETSPPDEIPEILDLDDKWQRFKQAAFVETRTVSLYDRMRPILSIAAAVLLLIAGGLVWKTLFQKADPVYVVQQSHDQLMQVTLPDGSLVHLDKMSEIRYAQDFDRRSVELKGKALFEVQHLDDDRPFTVLTSQTQTTVLGTIFMVNALDEQREVQVFVKEGRVSFQQSNLSSNVEILDAGEEAIYQVQSGAIEKTDQVGESNHLSWKTGVFSFDDAPLSEILPLIEHYYNVSFNVKNSGLLDCTYNTDFSNEDLSTIIEELSFGLSLKITSSSDTRYEIDGVKCN